MRDLMNMETKLWNRRTILAAAGAACLVSPSAALAASSRGEGFKTFHYRPKDAFPFFPPLELTSNEVDHLIWPAVRLINTSGWVWTAESCQGHKRKNGWSHVPLIRLVCRKNDIGDLMELIYRTAKHGRFSKTLDSVGYSDVLTINRHEPGYNNWTEFRISAGPSRSRGRYYFRRLAKNIVATGIGGELKIT